MGKKNKPPELPEISDKEYSRELHKLQIQLVKLQSHLIKHAWKILVIFEGRDGGGKDGTIKRITEHLSPRETRSVALGKPSDHDLNSWYFQRWVPHLPASHELVLFNRSWYNRAGVEWVMGFCSRKEYEEFFEAAPHFEQMLVSDGIKFFKYYLDISKEEQAKRLRDRKRDQLKQWKSSPIDDQALKHWKDYTRARDEMFARTHTAFAPWIVVRADKKFPARLNVIKDLLSRLNYKGKSHKLARPNPKVVFEYDESYLKNGMIAS